MSNHATVLNVQRFTLHDGPGIRTEFFLKGCPLRCQWCGNPESFNRDIEVGVYQNRCIGQDKCDGCTEVCPNSNSLIFSQGTLSNIERNNCDGCLNCVEECPAESAMQWGNTMTVEQCMAVIEQDRGFYQRSGGGVTVSGGEPLLQSEFVARLFQACQSAHIHTCLETSLFSHWDKVASLLPVTDLFISDIKLMDSKAHKQHTGVDNHKILHNLTRLVETGKPLILRIPVIPFINDHQANIEQTADFIVNELEGKIESLQLLSFMRLGEEKYQSLGLDYPMESLKFDRVTFQQRVSDIADYFRTRGIHCTVGTKS